jgi:GNAT superfamily N-acetyltransferase
MKIDQDILNDLSSYLKKVKYKNKIQDLKLEHCTDEHGDYIYLVLIKIKKSQRNKGYANAIIDDIVRLADNHNVRVKLWMTNVFGAELNRLSELYKKHGFVLVKDFNDGNMIYFPSKMKQNKEINV